MHVRAYLHMQHNAAGPALPAGVHYEYNCCPLPAGATDSLSVMASSTAAVDADGRPVGRLAGAGLVACPAGGAMAAFQLASVTGAGGAMWVVASLYSGCTETHMPKMWQGDVATYACGHVFSGAGSRCTSTALHVVWLSCIDSAMLLAAVSSRRAIQINYMCTSGLLPGS